ncbi:MAG: hypothetical protein H0X13_10570 [Ramlibacter sp.]|nr:hypothetical protein [Ramlibacter sp.]
MSAQILNPPQPQAQERDPNTLSIGIFGQIDPSVVDYLAGHHLARQEAPAGFDLKSVISELDGIVIRSPFRLDDECALVASRLKGLVEKKVLHRRGTARENVACLPGSHQTRHLLNRERLSQLRRGAFLVNVGRGSLIELSALESALDSGHLAGVALDAYEVEPPGHMAIFDRDNVLCTPHLGAQTQEAQKAVGAGVIAHLRGLLTQ